ncbi:MAG TPA: PBP1A family penicillin-binding protein [Croceibacterium sp.]|nr:PBP1A family penicillin-binding protein [Croceibacterium sp.]
MADKRGSRSRQRRENERRQRAKPPRSRSTGWRLWLRRLFVWGGSFTLLCAFALGCAVFFAARSVPSFATLMGSQNGQTIVVRARDGTEIVELGPNYGQWLTWNQIPRSMKDAMVAAEDRRFYHHIGVDPLGLTRAVYTWATGSKRISATSTITQQLARNVFLNSNRTIDRKLREAVLAMALEAKFSKQEILELYLNKVYFGGGAYGIDSASRKFFSHPATHLSNAEAAIIAGMVKAPSRFSPTADVDAAVARANVVLGLMRDQGMITAEEASVDVRTVNLKKEEGQNSVRYFTDWALPQLDLLLPDGNTDPIQVWTTIDLGMQKAATQAIVDNVPKGAQGALVSMDRDGAILAMVGGTDYVKTNYNRATEALRQPGSAWKLFVYLAALEAGYKPDDKVKDVPVTIDGWSPHNDGGYAGEIDVRSAFAYSKNTVAAQLGNEVGFGAVASMARRFGITTPISTYPSMVLGTNEVRVLDMTRAFAEVSAKGQSLEPYGILKVATASGRVLYEHQNQGSSQLVPDYVAAGITDLLQTAVNTGTGRAAQIGRPVAGKTGTTNSNKDGWFLGFSSGITTGVWMGRDDAKPVGGLWGGTSPARTFADFMRYAVKDRPVEKFDTDLKLPDWQLEPDDEHMQGNPQDYYFIDENGNLVPPPGPDQQRGNAVPPDATEPDRRPQPGGQPVGPPPQAASDDFLQRATGNSAPREPAARRPAQVPPSRVNIPPPPQP